MIPVEGTEYCPQIGPIGILKLTLTIIGDEAPDQRRQVVPGQTTSSSRFVPGAAVTGPPGL